MKEKSYSRANNQGVPRCVSFGNFLNLSFSVTGNFRFFRDSSVCRLSSLFSAFSPLPAPWNGNHLLCSLPTEGKGDD